MMGDLFVRILNVSMVSCYTIVVVMVVRALLLRWERKFVYLLWFVVFVNLCIPFRPEGPFSLVPAWIADFDIAARSGNGLEAESEGKVDYLPNEQIVVTETGSVTHHNYETVAGGNGVPGTDSNSGTAYESEGKTDYLPNEQITVTESVGHGYESGLTGGVPGTDSNHETIYHEYHTGGRKTILAFVWGAGVVLLAAGNLWAAWKLRGKLKGAEPFAGDAGIAEQADKGIRTVDGIESPFLWGFSKPVIYLPRSVDVQECTYIIAHERYHRRRKDYIFKPLFFAVAVVHWFNPLVWAAYLLFVRDMEISCDEAVIAGADEDIRKQYAASLLKYAARQNGYMLTPLTFGEPSPKCRIRNVLRYRERDMVGSALVLCGVVSVMAGLFFKPRQESLMIQPFGLENVEITQGIPDMLAADAVGAGTFMAPRMEFNWKSGMIRGMDGENEYTKILTGSGMVSDEAADFRTFAYAESAGAVKVADGEGQDGGLDSDSPWERDGMHTVAYVMAGEETGGVVTGSLWRVDVRNEAVQPVMRDIVMADIQAETVAFDDAVYVILNYLSEERADGRILPVAGNALSGEIMADYFGEKGIGDMEGTIVCNGSAYWLIDAETVQEADGHDASQDEGRVRRRGDELTD